MPAPRKPWIARHRIICSMEEARPQRKLAKVKPAAEIANNSRVPNARDRKPDKGIAITSAIKYEVCTQETSVELAESPAWMSDSDADTTWMSRIDMNIPNTMIRKAASRRGAMRSEGAAPIMAGDAVVSVAILTSILFYPHRGALPRPACGERVGVRGNLNRSSSRRVPLTRIASQSDLSPQAGRGGVKLLWMNHRRRVEVGIALRILSALSGVDGHVDGHAGAQEILPRNILRHANPDRQSLHDLGKIAGGVVGRQQREDASRGRRDAFDGAGELAMTIGIDRNRHRLATRIRLSCV